MDRHLGRLAGRVRRSIELEVTVIDGGDPLLSSLWISACQFSHAQPLE